MLVGSSRLTVFSSWLVLLRVWIGETIRGFTYLHYLRFTPSIWRKSLLLTRIGFQKGRTTILVYFYSFIWSDCSWLGRLLFLLPWVVLVKCYHLCVLTGLLSIFCQAFCQENFLESLRSTIQNQSHIPWFFFQLFWIRFLSLIFRILLFFYLACLWRACRVARHFPRLCIRQ